MAEQTAASAPFRQVDPLIAAPPSPVSAEPYAIPPIGFRPDIEGLRAIAVALVVLFHAEIGPFGGGYIGVDVFFVVSGFLITSLLLGEVARTGTLSLPRFWARRARRLLPASCLVIVATVIVGAVALRPVAARQPRPRRRRRLRRSSSTTSSPGASPTATAATSTPTSPSRRCCTSGRWPSRSSSTCCGRSSLGLARTAHRLRHELTLVIVVLWVLSAAACVWLTAPSPPWAFYSLPTRAWELLTGALLAVSITSLRPIHRSLVLPMAAGRPGDRHRRRHPLRRRDDVPRCRRRGAGARHGPGHRRRQRASPRRRPARVLGSRPMLWVGQRSYAIYLWHWPALVLIGAEWGPLSLAQRIAVVAGSVGAGHRFVPLRRGPGAPLARVAARPRRSLLTGVSMLTVTALIAVLLLANPHDVSGGGRGGAR